MYTDQVIKHFKNPKNMGKIKNPDAQSEAANDACGDLMQFYIKVRNNKITEISFETMGCPAAIATSSVVTEIAKGKTLAQAKKISFSQVAKELGGLPKIKMHCSHLAVGALLKAIKNYEKKKN